VRTLREKERAKELFFRYYSLNKKCRVCGRNIPYIDKDKTPICKECGEQLKKIDKDGYLTRECVECGSTWKCKPAVISWCVSGCRSLCISCLSRVDKIDKSQLENSLCFRDIEGR
jgi:hypothetical protein